MDASSDTDIDGIPGSPPVRRGDISLPIDPLESATTMLRAPGSSRMIGFSGHATSINETPRDSHQLRTPPSGPAGNLSSDDDFRVDVEISKEADAFVTALSESGHSPARTRAASQRVAPSFVRGNSMKQDGRKEQRHAKSDKATPKSPAVASVKKFSMSLTGRTFVPQSTETLDPPSPLPGKQRKALSGSGPVKHYDERPIVPSASSPVSTRSIMSARSATTSEVHFKIGANCYDIGHVKECDMIEHDELKLTLRSCLLGSSIHVEESDLEALTGALYRTKTDDKNNMISYEELREKLERNPELLETLAVSAPRWLRDLSNEKKPYRSRVAAGCRCLTVSYCRNNCGTVLFFWLFFLVNAALSLWNGIEYRSKPLNFNCVFVVVLMFKKTITYLRSSPLKPYLPLDQCFYFHRVVGWTITAQSIIHTGAHLANFAIVTSLDEHFTYYDYLLTTKPGLGWVYGTASITGLALLALLALIVTCALPCVRGRGRFQLFFWTHFLHWPFMVVNVLHAPDFWKWFIVPGVYYLIEYVIGMRPCRTKQWRRGRTSNAFVTQARILPSGVTHLVLSRPDAFDFEAGDYVFIKIPTIAAHEWHAFTISSNPQQTDSLWVHIRSQGPWTDAVYKYFNKFYDDAVAKSSTFAYRGRLSSSIRSQPINARWRPSQLHFTVARDTGPLVAQRIKDMDTCLPVCIDGPYAGGSSREILQTEHAVIISCGIGVTPYAAVLQNILSIYNACMHQCPNCEHSWTESCDPHIMRLRKVDFIWINRDQHCFEWFISILTQLELDQADINARHFANEDRGDRFLEIQLFMTKSMDANSMKAIGLQMALDVLQEKSESDVIKRLNTRIQPGRPHWDELFRKISQENKGAVKVFMCAKPSISHRVKQHCRAYGFTFIQENF
ncbi:NADPH oxidase 5-like [Tubulanus polymorphus]|uniref:NADPH oxidase 5-like n=1 Tax=Tubulanus polymorphus TaxID=672921 RepID=UPI003DA35236